MSASELEDTKLKASARLSWVTCLATGLLLLAGCAAPVAPPEVSDEAPDGQTSQSIVSLPITYTGFGANMCVSGSMHLVSMGGERILLDAGSFYSDDGDQYPELDPSIVNDLSAVVISHAHGDHTGRLLMLARFGYDGPIYCSEPTRQVLPLMLAMSSRYGDFGEESFYFSERSRRDNSAQGKPTPVHSRHDCEYGQRIAQSNLTVFSSHRDQLSADYYLCSYCVQAEVDLVMNLMRPVDLYETVTIGPNLTMKLFRTPHVPGSVMTQLTDAHGYTLVYTGDFGSGFSPFLTLQDSGMSANIIIAEGTYGAAARESPEDAAEARVAFHKLLGEQVRQGRRVIIPAFVFDRTQQVLYEIKVGKETGHIPSETPVKLFGTTAPKINDVYDALLRDEAVNSFLTYGQWDSGFLPHGLIEIRSLPADEVSQSVARGEIAVCSAGMGDEAIAAEFIREWAADPNTSFVFVGYVAPDTLGGRLIAAASSEDALITIDNLELVVEAQVYQVGCFSGHGSFDQISSFAKQVDGLETLVLVHLERLRADELAMAYEGILPSVDIIVPEPLETIVLAE